MHKLTRLAAFAAMVFSTCVQAQICTPATDVLASSSFCTDIQWMFNRGITSGCHAQGQPVSYCPEDFVRRDQMARLTRLLSDVQASTESRDQHRNR
jgi:hypothetical protein